MNLNKTVRGVCSICLSAFLTFPMTSLSSVFAGISDSGDCGAVSTYNTENSVSWNVDSDGVLTISGSGEMENFTEPSNSPWYDKESNITSIKIENGITSIGDYAFYGLGNAKKVEIPSSVTRIGIDAFKNSGCETTKEPGVDDGVRYVGEWITSFNPSEERKSSDIEIKDGTIGTADFAASGVDVHSILLPEGIQYIGQNFLTGSSLKDVYFKGTGEGSLKLNEIPKGDGVNLYYTVVSVSNIKIKNINGTPSYHVDERPTFSATLEDNGGTASRLTMKEKWVNINDTTDEITKDNGKKFKDGVTYKYVIVLELNNNKFSFDVILSINKVTIEYSNDPLVGSFTFIKTFKALSGIKSAEVFKSENLDVSCTSVGLEPTFAKNAGSDDNYSIAYEAWEKVNSSGDVEKRAVYGEYPSSETEVSKLENFEQNGLYRYIVCLKPNEGYYFEPNMVTKLGGKIVDSSEKTEDKVIMTSAVFEANHSFPLTKNDRVEPTCIKPGNIEYYKCSKCNKLFEDDKAERSLTSDDTVLATVDHEYEKVPAVKPTCTKKGNIEYFKCKKCGKLLKSENGNPGEEITDTSSVEIDTIPHTFDENTFISNGETGHYHKCKYCDARSEIVAHIFDKKVEDEKYLKEGLTCGDVISYYKSCECGESSKGTSSEETFENEKGKKVEHEFGKDGVCTICKATDYKLSAVDGNTYTETENGSLIFRANGSIDKLLNVKVDDVILTKDKEYTVKAGSTIVELKNDYLKTLSAGQHKLTVVYEDGKCETKFDVKAASDSKDDGKTTDDTNDDTDSSKGNIVSDIIYKTGDNAGLISLISTVLTSGLASVWFTKKREKNR